jgi:hypothetical protein
MEKVTCNCSQKHSDLPYRVIGDRLVDTRCAEEFGIRLGDVRRVRLCRFGSGRLCLTLYTISSGSLRINWDSSQDKFGLYSAFVAALLLRISQYNQFVEFEMGLSELLWFGCLACVSLSALSISYVLWVGLSGHGFPTWGLPLALTPISLMVAAPLLLSGRSRSVGLHHIVNELESAQIAP